jgi:hypothetical protein
MSFGGGQPWVKPCATLDWINVRNNSFLLMPTFRVSFRLSLNGRNRIFPPSPVVVVVVYTPLRHCCHPVFSSWDGNGLDSNGHGSFPRKHIDTSTEIAV